MKKEIRSLQLEIHTPCQAGPENMLPHEKGNFCTSCQKVVHDISRMTDKEIIDLIGKSSLGGGLCAKAMPSQLGRMMYRHPATLSSGWKPWTMAFLAALALPAAFPSPAAAQTAKENVLLKNAAAGQPIYPNVIHTATGSFYELRGYATTKDSPAANVDIRIQDSLRAKTDSNGNFFIHIPVALFKNDSVKLFFSSADIPAEAFYLDLKHEGESHFDLNKDFLTILPYPTEETTMMMGGIVAYKHPLRHRISTGIRRMFSFLRRRPGDENAYY
jgi:hypothetical protein